MNPEGSHLVFVYGTLKRGWDLAHLMGGERFLGQAMTQPLYRLFRITTYPGLVDAPDDGVSIEGELWKVSNTKLRELDEVEGISIGEYERRAIQLLPPFESEGAEAYFFLRPTTPANRLPGSWDLPG